MGEVGTLTKVEPAKLVPGARSTSPTRTVRGRASCSGTGRNRQWRSWSRSSGLGNLELD